MACNNKFCVELQRIQDEFARNMRMITDGTHPELIAAREKRKKEDAEIAEKRRIETEELRLKLKPIFDQLHRDSVLAMYPNTVFTE